MNRPERERGRTWVAEGNKLRLITCRRLNRTSARSADRRSGRGADRDFLHLAADEGLVFAKVGFETVGQPAGGLVIGLLVGPGATRVEYLGGHLGAALRHEQTEIRLLADRRGCEAPIECGAEQGAGMGDRHTPADA